MSGGSDARAKRSATLEGLTLLQIGEDDLKSAGWLYNFHMKKAARLRLKTASLFIEAAIIDGLIAGAA